MMRLAIIGASAVIGGIYIGATIASGVGFKQSPADVPDTSSDYAYHGIQAVTGATIAIVLGKILGA